MLIVGVASVLFLTLIDAVNSNSYCWYRHEKYDTVQQKYCKSGCCQDVGDDNDICCFEWTIGVIIGVCFAAITFITIVVICIICCYTIKSKHNRTVTTVDYGAPNISNTVIYSAASGFAYPHPPSAFYPTSQFPNALPAHGPHPKYAMYTSSDPNQSQSSSQDAPPPPSYMAATDPIYPPSQQYGGYNGNGTVVS